MSLKVEQWDQLTVIQYLAMMIGFYIIYLRIIELIMELSNGQRSQ